MNVKRLPLHLAVVIALVLAVMTVSCARDEKYIVVHVFRDGNSTFARQLDRAFDDFNNQQRRNASGELIVVATFEASDFGKMLHDRIGAELEPDVIIIGPSNQKDLNSVVRKELKGAKDVCKEHECVAAIPSWVSERERGAAEQLVHYLAENPVSSTPKS